MKKSQSNLTKNRYAGLRCAAGWLVVFIGISILKSPICVCADLQELDKNIKKRETSFYRDFFNSVIYKPFANFLRFDHIPERLEIKKTQALDINVFDEVPDSNFFINRHGKNRIAADELKKGPSQEFGLATKGTWAVTKGRVEDVGTAFFIKDQAGKSYLLKFDPKDNPEMASAAEIIGHKFFEAIGYNVPEYDLVYFLPDILTPDPKATYYDSNGFKKLLTQEALKNITERIPKMKSGQLRASARKLLEERVKGYMDFENLRIKDPDDLIPHEDRRSTRALRVFGSWLNHYDLRPGNTLDVIEEENGKAFVRHYLIDFGSTLGSGAYRPKVPVAGYEHVVDWYEIGKAIPTMKLVQKPWELRWDEAKRKVEEPALGFFDNYYFNPGKWKSQLDEEAFNRLTSGDGFWASKIIMSFTNEDIRAIVSTGDFSDPKAADILSEILIVRRDLIGKYWFDRVTPLDRIQLFKTVDGNYELRFTDLPVKYGFEKSEDSKYRYHDVVFPDKTKKQKPVYHEFNEPSFSFNPSVSQEGRMTLALQVKRPGKPWSEPPLEVRMSKANNSKDWQVSGVDHGA